MKPTPRKIELVNDLEGRKQWPPLTQTALLAGDIAPESWLLAAATVLTGVAGPLSAWKSTLRNDPVGALNAMVPAGELRLRGCFDQLLHPTLTIEHLLRRNSGKFREELLERARCGSCGPCKSSEYDNPNYAAVQEHKSQLLLNEHGSGGKLPALMEEDISSSAVRAREEALLRPGMLVCTPRSDQLGKLLAECHLQEGLVTGQAGELLLGRRKPGTPRLEEYLESVESLHSGRCASGRGFTPAGRLTRHRVRSTILEASREELGILHAKHTGLLGRFILATPGTITHIAAPDADTPHLMREFEKAVKTTINTRRQGRGLIRLMRDPRAAAHFETQRRQFLQELETLEHPEHFRAFANLPANLAWTLMVLVNQDVDQLILDLAVPYARRLLEHHRTVISGLVEDNRNKHRPSRELKMVERVRKLAPVTDRNLVRGFDNQRMAEHRPVIERLVQEGVLARDEKGKLIPGEDAEEFVALNAQNQNAETLSTS